MLLLGELLILETLPIRVPVLCKMPDAAVIRLVNVWILGNAYNADCAGYYIYCCKGNSGVNRVSG